MAFDRSNIFSFGGEFAGTGTKVDEKVKKTFKAGEIVTKYMDEVDKTRGLKSDTKSWKVLNGMYDRGDYKVALASGKDFGICELFNTITGYTSVVYAKEVDTGSTRPTLQFSAADFSPLGTSEKYNTTHQGSALLAAFIALRYEKDDEVFNAVNEYKDLVNEDPNSSWYDDPARAEKIALVLGTVSNALFYTVKHKYDLPTFIAQLRQDEIEQIGRNVEKFNFGTPKIVKVNTLAGRKGLFDLNPERKLTPEEEKMVPIMPDNYQWSEYQFSLAQEIRDSQNFEEPTNVILLYGDAGSGKSKGARGIASLLKRPIVIWTADPDTDEFKLIGSTMPNTKKGNNLDMDTLCKEQGLPTFEDVAFDFERSFEILFGRKPTSVDDPCDCYKEIARRVKCSDSDFIFVESPIIKALRNGWVVEIQEPTIIKRSSVLVALNSMLDYTNELMLPTGETINRHKEAVVIMTSNMDYEGCRALQQSVLSRINDIREIPTPNADELFRRAQANTGFRDKTILTIMSQIIANINEICKNEDIRDGVCGTRELQSWAKKAMLFQKRRDNQFNKIEKEVAMGAAFPTVINHVSQNPEDREKIITSCFGVLFTPQEITAGRELYMAGLV